MVNRNLPCQIRSILFNLFTLGEGNHHEEPCILGKVVGQTLGSLFILYYFEELY